MSMGHSTTQLGMGPVTSFHELESRQHASACYFKPSMLFDLGPANTLLSKLMSGSLCRGLRKSVKSESSLPNSPNGSTRSAIVGKGTITSRLAKSKRLSARPGVPEMHPGLANRDCDLRDTDQIRSPKYEASPPAGVSPFFFSLYVAHASVPLIFVAFFSLPDGRISRFL